MSQSACVPLPPNEVTLIVKAPVMPLYEVTVPCIAAVGAARDCALIKLPVANERPVWTMKTFAPLEGVRLLELIAVMPPPASVPDVNTPSPLSKSVIAGSNDPPKEVVSKVTFPFGGFGSDTLSASERRITSIP